MIWRSLLLVAALTCAAPAYAGSWCGGQTSNGCSCGKVDIYPCCDNGGNCTWYAWRSMCCHWGYGPGNYGNANTWAGNGKKDPNLVWLPYPVVGAVATRDLGQYGHVAYVVEVSGSKIKVEEENCCDSCGPGMGIKWYNASYFNSGFLIHKNLLGPQCGNGKCESGENCSNCGQDCGACCGNGSCDYGENCESCNKDCHCMPQGGLDTANCSGADGWAWDPDTPANKLKIKVKCNGTDKASLIADGPHPGHEGRGFAWSVPPELKNGQVCTLTAEAQDSNSSGFTTLGPKAFVCDNATSYEGIWVTTRKDAAGIAMQLPKGAHEGLQHVHAAGYPYPLSGVVKSCTQPSLEPFAELRANLTWDLQSKLHHVVLSVDGETRGAWQGDADPAQELVLTDGGRAICLATTALAQVDAPQAQAFTLTDMRWRTVNSKWWNGYSQDGGGLTIGHPQADGARMQVRPGSGGAHGLAQVWLDLPETLDGVRYVLSAVSAAAMQPSLQVGNQTLPGQTGAQEMRGVQGKRLTLQVAAEGVQPSDAAITWQQVRVFQAGTRAEGPWTVTRHDAWGLGAGVPEDATPTAAGLSVALGSKAMGWWTTGAVTAALDVFGVPFERVRARLQTRHPDLAPGTQLPVRLGVSADDSPVADLPLTATEGQLLDVVSRGHRLSLSFALLLDQPDAEANLGVRLDGLELLRRGWWTAPSPHCVGLRDDRPLGGGVLLETARAWGMAGHALEGHARVHTTFAQAQTGVRFHYQQDLDGSAVRVLLLADGLPLAVFDEVGLVDKDVEFLSPGFHDVAMVLTAKSPGMVVPQHWWAAFTHVQTRDAQGKWQAVQEAALPPDSAGPGATLPGMADAAVLTDAGAAQAAVASARPGCAASPRPMSGGWAVCWLALAWVIRRRARA